MNREHEMKLNQKIQELTEAYKAALSDATAVINELRRVRETTDEIVSSMNKECDLHVRHLDYARNALFEIADLENPNEPKDICSPTSEYMKLAREALQKMGEIE